MSHSSQHSSSQLPQDNAFEDLDALLAEPDKTATALPQTDKDADKFDDLGNSIVDNLIDRSSYQGLAGMPARAIPGKKYVCPVEDCSAEPWYQLRAGMSPPLCEVHGVVFVAAEDDAGQP